MSFVWEVCIFLHVKVRGTAYLYLTSIFFVNAFHCYITKCCGKNASVILCNECYGERNWFRKTGGIHKWSFHYDTVVTVWPNIVQTIPERWHILMDNFFVGCWMGIQSTQWDKCTVYWTKAREKYPKWK